MRKQLEEIRDKGETLPEETAAMLNLHLEAEERNAEQSIDANEPEFDESAQVCSIFSGKE